VKTVTFFPAPLCHSHPIPPIEAGGCHETTARTPRRLAPHPFPQIDENDDPWSDGRRPGHGGSVRRLRHGHRPEGGYAYRNDYGTAFSYWLPLARQGDARAQFNLGLMYHSGLFVEQDEARALYWYHQAAANGIREAQEYLVVGYSEGWFGLDKDEAKAKYWEQRLAENQ